MSLPAVATSKDTAPHTVGTVCTDRDGFSCVVSRVYQVSDTSGEHTYECRLPRGTAIRYHSDLYVAT